ncbi:MAG: peptidoglycan bridge formation glycyltransferase FemA/FemB family protein [Bacteroidales bacterium]
MLSEIHKKEIGYLLETPIVQQTAFWSVVKRKLGETTMAINFKSDTSCLQITQPHKKTIVSDVLVILKHVDSQRTIAYVPYGPELEPKDENQGAFLEELSESLRSFLPKGCIMIRYDLCWESYWAKEKNYYDENGWWIGPPQVPAQEFRFNINTFNWNFKKSQSNILPSNTIFINLQRNPADLLKAMRPKTRYNIGLANRKGVTVRIMGMESLPIWYALYRETAMRNHIYLNDIKYFDAVLSAKAHDSLSPAEAFLLVADFDNKPLAAMFLIISGHRGSYLYGASSTENRNLMATYALQWKAIQIAKERGCTEYDMFGVTPRPDQSHPLYGLYQFKRGFGGNLYHSLGCWDYPLIVDEYQYFRTMELKSQGYHLH